MARADTVTLLPLDRYAAVLGINPIHFNSATLASLFPNNLCKDKWRQYDWQDDGKVSRDAMAREIARAERDIAAEFRYWPAPNWTENEEIIWPAYYRPERTATRGTDTGGYAKSVQTEFGRFIEGGTRAVTLVEADVTVTRSDEDGDGYGETATITVNGVTQADVCKLKVYVPGKNGERSWEVRPHRSKTLSGGTLTVTFWSWQFIDPARWEALRGAFQDVDLTDNAVYLTEADVYYEYTDPTNSTSLVWRGTEGNAHDVDLTSQTAALRITDAHNGFVSPIPASYADGVWTEGVWPIDYEPERVVVSYYSGLKEGACDQLPDDLAMAVAYMATARLSRPLCENCQTIRDREKELKRDLAESDQEKSHYMTEMLARCPFGTKQGEYDAWKIVSSRLAKHGRQGKVALL